MSSTERIDRGRSEAMPGDALVDGLLRKAHARLERELALIRRPDAAVGVVGSPLGPLMIAEGPRGLVMIHYMGHGDAEQAIATLRQKFDPILDVRAVRPVVREIRRLLDGDLTALTRRVDLSLVGSGFRLEALKRLRDIPAGSVVTYQALATLMHAPNAQRAVGSAMATNPIPVYVPCHRVVRSDGSVGWYGGGPSRKVKLLRAEGFEIDRSKRLMVRAVLGHRETRIFCRPECHAAQRANILKVLIFAGPEAARRAGMRPCKLCRPGTTSADRRRPER